MNNIKLIHLLKTFSKQEVKKFKDFVNSPYFNKSVLTMKLSDEVMKYYPMFNADDFTEEVIFKKLFKDENYNYFKLKNVISDLYQLAVLFLKEVAIEKKNIENEIILLNELHERKLDTVYQQREKLVTKQLEDYSVKDEFYFQKKYELARVNTFHYKFIKTGYAFDLIQNEFDIFLQYSMIVLLRNYSKMLTNKNHGNIEFNLEMFDQVWEYVKDKDFNNNPSIKIYKQLVTLEISKDEKDYRSLLSVKDRFGENLSKEDVYYVLLVANSYAVSKIKLGDESYYIDRYKILREMVDRKIQLPENILFVNFTNTYTAACMANDFEWANEFLLQFQDGITPAEERTNSVNFCKAFSAFRKKEYDKALEYFSKTNFKLFLMKVMVKSYTVRIYYEQNMYEQTFSAIDAFRHYLKSEKMIKEDQKNAHYEFLKFISELTLYKSENLKSKNDIRYLLLKKRIKEMQVNPLGAKNWLIEKANNFFD